MRYAVFLRGINVGSARRVPMEELRQVVAAAGLAEPRTLLNSGNLLVASELDAVGVRTLVERVLADAFGIALEAIVLPHPDLAAVVAASPYGTGRNAQVAFCSDAVTPDQLATVKGLAGQGEGASAAGSLLYLNLPFGVAGSKLATGLVRALRPTIVTVRTLATVDRMARA